MKTKIKKAGIFSVVLFLALTLNSFKTIAHCDTMDGPLIMDAKKAIDQNNVNYVLKWVPASGEAEVRQAFGEAMKNRTAGSDATAVAEKKFYETVVRIHRAAEGVSFTGIKPSGTPIDKKILAADKAIETGNISTLKDIVPAEKFDELAERFERVMALKNFNVNDVEAGRKYIAAYVRFFKFAEGEE